MPKKPFKKMTKEELAIEVYGYRQQIIGDGYERLQYQREESHSSFVHDFTNQTVPTTGMSSVLFNFMSPCTETLTDYMTKVFCSDKETVVFNPDEYQYKPVAEQLTKMVNSVIHKHNDGYYVLNRLFKDAALNKNGIVKISWVESEESFSQEYEGMTEEELFAVLDEYEQKGYECEWAEEDDGSIRIRCTRMMGKPVIENIPPEEFLINEGAIAINDRNKTEFVGHRKLMKVGDILEMFPKAKLEDLGGQDNELEFDEETQNRGYHDGTYRTFGTDTGTHHTQSSRREILEAWTWLDMNGDGILECIHSFSVGKNVLMYEEWDGPIPFASFTYFDDPHKFYGLSLYDKLRRYEQAATGLLRSSVDMANQQSTFRILADPRYVDERNLQSGRPGVIPVKPGFDPKFVLPLPTPPGAGAQTNAIIELIKMQVIAEIGIDPINGQISMDIGKSGNDATKTAMAIDNASSRIEGYAREFAEVALAEIVWQISKMLVEHSDNPFVVKLANDSKPDELQEQLQQTGSNTEGFPFLAAELGIDDIYSKANLTSKVGLGHLTGQQRVGATQALLQAYQIMTQDPNAPLSLDTQGKYKILAEIAKGFNYENPEDLIGTMQGAMQSTEQVMQQKQQQTQAATQQAQAQMQQAQTAQQATQSKIQLDEADQQHRHGLEVAKNEAETRAQFVEAEKRLAETKEALANIEKIKAETEKLLKEALAVGKDSKDD